MAAIPHRNFVTAPDHEPYPAWMQEYRWALMVGSFILVAIVAISIAAMRSLPPSTHTDERLRVDSRNRQWLIRWDADAAAVRATLVVSHDAQTQTIDLTPNLYAGASLLLPQQSPDLDVLLRTERGGKAISEIRTRVVALDPSSNPAKVRPPATPPLHKKRRRN